MLRSVGKTCLACAYTWSGASRLIANPRKNAEGTPLIVGYHRVVESFHHSKTTAIPSMLISTSMLERHVDWLAKRFSFVSLDEVGLHLELDRPFGRRTVAVTFDDGYSDVYHHAYPLLKKKGIPAGVFVVTDLVGTGRPQIFDRFYLLLRSLQRSRLPLAKTIAGALHASGFDASPMKTWLSSDLEPFRLMTIALNAFPQDQIEAALASLENSSQLRSPDLHHLAPLTWDMIESMHRGGITIGSHTGSHRLLPAESTETVRSELLNSKNALEARLSTTIKHFAYPGGCFNPAVVRTVKAAGYRFGYGVCQSRDRDYPLLTIPRKLLWERSCVNVLGRFSPSVMNCNVHWVFDREDRCEHDHMAAAARQHGRID
jgi:peptidoglycan/xylan/chitin deacetylase (PgdA/CDA1 family)